MTSVELYLAGATFLAALASGLAGFAFALIASGIYLHLLDPAAAVALVLAGSLAAQAVTILRVRGGLSWPRLWPFLLGGVLGVPLGTALLDRLDPATFRFVIGLFLIGYSAFMLVVRDPPRLTAGGRPLDGLIGLIGGAMGGLAGLSGAIPTVWCGLRGWSRDEQRGVYQPYIVAMQGLAFVSLLVATPIAPRTGVLFLVCLPALLLGAFAGLAIYKRVGEAGFRRIVLVLLLASGLSLLFG